MADEKIRQLFCQLLKNPLPGAVLGEQLESLALSEWEELSTYAKQNSLTGIVYTRLRHLSVKFPIPTEIQKQLHQDYIKSVTTNVYLIKYTNQVLRALKTRGLNVIGLKGIYLLDNVYEDIGLRSLGDVDLLVREPDLAAVIACLKGLGFHNKTWFDPQDDNQDLMHVPPMINKDGLIIELHWRISFEEDPFAFDIDGLWQRAVPARIADVALLALSVEDLLLQLCFHTSYHHVLLIGFQGLYDIREVIEQRQAQIDWNALIQLANEAGAERVLALSLRLLESVLAFRVPDPSAARLADQVDPDTLAQALKLLFYQPAVNNYQVRTEHIARFLSASGIKERARLIRDRFLLPKQEMARRYDVSPNSLWIYFYYPVRLVEFIINNPRVVKGFVKRGVSQNDVQMATEEFFHYDSQQQQIKDWMSYR